MIGRNGRKLVSHLCKQCRNILFNVCKDRICSIGHKCAVESSLHPLQWISHYMLMKPAGFSEKPFHVISFMGIAQTFFHNKSHEKAERGIIGKMIPDSHVLLTVYAYASFKKTLKILPAPQDLCSGQTKIAA